jgi:hypothetical protein
MLLGIHCGDWGTSAPDLAAARNQAIIILANWPNSDEATLLKQWLRWDDQNQRTRFNYLPKTNEAD